MQPKISEELAIWESHNFNTRAWSNQRWSKLARETSTAWHGATPTLYKARYSPEGSTLLPANSAFVSIVEQLVPHCHVLLTSSRSNLVSHEESFIPHIARRWNVLPPHIPGIVKRTSFKKEINSYLGANPSA